MTNIFKALANFQQECPVVHKGTQGYGYTYAGLPQIFQVINPLLKKHGLGFTQLVQSETIETILFHSESGETIKSMTDIPQGVQLAKMNEFQVAGSAITYYRRYALSSMLGIITDDDPDASGEQVKPSFKKRANKQQAPKKEKLEANTDKFNSAKEYIAKGGKISAIESKYVLTDDIKKLLTQ